MKFVQRHNATILRRFASSAILLGIVVSTGCCGPCLRRPWFFPPSPPPERKTIEELYLDAVSQARPEQTLGIQEAPNSAHVAAGGALSSAYFPPLSGHPNLIPPAPDLTPIGPEIPSLPPVSPGPTLPEEGLIGPPTTRIDPPLSTSDGFLQPLVLETESSGVQRTVGSGDRSRRVIVVAGTEEVRITDFFEETDIRQAIQSIATQAGATVVLDDQVSGVVSVILDQEPFESALQKLLLPLGFVSKKLPDGTYLVGVADPQSPLFSRISTTAVYQTRHISPEALKETLPPRWLPFIRTIEKRNRILIEAPEEIAEAIVAQLAQADQAVPQVMLEAIVCVVSPDSGYRFGLDWGHAVELNGKTALELNMSGLAFNGGVSPIGVKNGFTDFAITSAFVKLLAQEGYLTIRASPRVMALDGERAEISIARQTFFSVAPATADQYFRQEIREVEAGIELAIIPTVRGDRVQVKIEKAEVSEDIRTQVTDRELVDNPYPLINRRRVMTNVTVQDGRTIVIGGLVARQTVDRISRVPGFGKIPKIGRLFEKVEKQEQDAEVVIFISPKIIHSGSDDVTAQEAIPHVD